LPEELCVVFGEAADFHEGVGCCLMFC
jgi:hypothetical protein